MPIPVTRAAEVSQEHRGDPSTDLDAKSWVLHFGRAGSNTLRLWGNSKPNTTFPPSDRGPRSEPDSKRLEIWRKRLTSDPEFARSF